MAEKTVIKKGKQKFWFFFDPCSMHPPDIDFFFNIKIIFFLANCTSVLQPCDEGLIKNLKIHCRNQLVQLILLSIEEPKSKKMSVLNSMNMISLAWSEVTKRIINFQKSGICSSKI